MYDAFGNVLEKAEQLSNRIRYTGQQYDSVTGQYYLRARYYNPVLGRFLQEDVYQGDGLNLYAYCDNNPVMYSDPSGYASATNNYATAKTNGTGNGYTPDQQAVIELAKDAKRRGYIRAGDVNALLGWAQEYGISWHGPEIHPNRPGPASNVLHIHIGKVGHIPIR